MTIAGIQVRMARAALRLGVRDLAKAANVSPNTIARIEADLPANASTLNAIKQALEAGGIEFIPENGGGAGVRLKHRTNPSDAASSSGGRATENES
jgi:transcriptional regulator with XRE-family HTH domain